MITGYTAGLGQIETFVLLIQNCMKIASLLTLEVHIFYLFCHLKYCLSGFQFFLFFDIINYHLIFLEPHCKPIQPIQNGDITPQWKGPRLIQYTYSCHHGYQLRGPRTVSCNDQGQWSSNPPTCRSK